MVAEYDQDSNQTESHVNNPQRIDEQFALTQTVAGVATKVWPIVDALGSIYAWTDRAGNIRDSYSYDVYGARTQLTGSDSIAWGYTGREHDPGTGLVYARDRYLNPSLGTWMQPDRAGMDAGPNAYSYVGNRPTIANDPLGFFGLIVYSYLSSLNINYSDGGADEYPFNVVKESWERTLLQSVSDELQISEDWEVIQIQSKADLAAVLQAYPYADELVYVGHANPTYLTTHFTGASTGAEDLTNINADEFSGMVAMYNMGGSGWLSTIMFAACQTVPYAQSVQRTLNDAGWSTDVWAYTSSNGFLPATIYGDGSPPVINKITWNAQLIRIGLPPQ